MESFIGTRIVVRIWRDGGVEELSSFSGFLHFGDYLYKLFFIFFWGVLFIEDAIFFVEQSHTAETIFTITTIIAVETLIQIVASYVEC